MTNFKIYSLESRLYWSWGGYGGTLGTPGPEGPPHTQLSGHLAADTTDPSQAMPREAHKSRLQGRLRGLDVRGMAYTGPWGSTRYSTHPAPTRYTLPALPSSRTPSGRSREPAVTGVAGPEEHAHMTVLRPSKEILGVWKHRGHAEAVSPLAPPDASALRPAPWRLLLGHSQYFSVYLSISVYLS